MKYHLAHLLLVQRTSHTVLPSLDRMPAGRRKGRKSSAAVIVEPGNLADNVAGVHRFNPTTPSVGNSSAPLHDIDVSSQDDLPDIVLPSVHDSAPTQRGAKRKLAEATEGTSSTC